MVLKVTLFNQLPLISITLIKRRFDRYAFDDISPVKYKLTFFLFLENKDQVVQFNSDLYTRSRVNLLPLNVSPFIDVCMTLILKSLNSCIV